MHTHTLYHFACRYDLIPTQIQVLVDDRQTARVRRVNAFIHSIQQKREDLFAQLATASDNRS